MASERKREASPNRLCESKKRRSLISESELTLVKNLPQCQVYEPSIEDFADPLAYIQKISQEVSQFGICKIKSPQKASVTAGDVLMQQTGFEFDCFIQKLNMPYDCNTQKTERTYSYQKFEDRANEGFAKVLPDQASSSLSDFDFEKQYWRELYKGTLEVEYCLAKDGSAFSPGNLMAFPKLANNSMRLLGQKIPRFTSPVLYLDSLYGSYTWKVDDHFLYSIDYHHSGAPKTWYCVPSTSASHFETVTEVNVLSNTLPSRDSIRKLACETVLFSPHVLKNNGVPVYKVVQTPGEYIVTFPRAYHSRFSQGFNCGEVINFGDRDWFTSGHAAGVRYALLEMPSILPYEEVLCKEAVQLSNNDAAADCPPVFIHHLKSINKALEQLRKFKPSPAALASVSKSSVVCHKCKRRCDTLFLTCDKCANVVTDACIHHAFETLNCKCGVQKKMYVRDLLLQAVEVFMKLAPNRVDDISLLQNMVSKLPRNA